MLKARGFSGRLVTKNYLALKKIKIGKKAQFFFQKEQNTSQGQHHHSANFWLPLLILTSLLEKMKLIQGIS